MTLKNRIEPPMPAYVFAIWPSFLFDSFVKIWETCEIFLGKWFTAPPGKKIPVRLWTVFPFFYVTFRKRSKRLTSACSSISWISCFTCACIRSKSIVTHRIDATAMGVGRTLVDIWEDVVKLGVKMRDFAYAWWQLSVTLINYSAVIGFGFLTLTPFPSPPHPPPPPPTPPLETCITLHITQCRIKHFFINWRYFKTLNRAFLHRCKVSSA